MICMTAMCTLQWLHIGEFASDICSACDKPVAVLNSGRNDVKHAHYTKLRYTVNQLRNNEVIFVH